MSVPYYDVQVNYNRRSGLIEVWMFSSGWHKVMVMDRAEIRINSDRAEAKRIVEDLLRGLRIVERNLSQL